MSQFQLLKSKKFAPLFWAQFLGAFNDNFLKNAIVIMITFKAVEVIGIPASQMVALAGGIFILPFFLLSATAGQLADKYEKSQIIRFVKIVEIAIMFIAMLGFVNEQFELLLFVLFLMGLHSTFFGPVKYSILPQLLHEQELVGGNALIEAGTFISILLGTIGGGVLISSANNGSLLVSSVLLVVAVLGYLASRFVPQAQAMSPDLKIQWDPFTPTWDIFCFTRTNREVYLSILGISWFWFLGAAILSLLPVYCKDVLHTTPGGVTLLLTCFSIGIALGSLLCEKLSQKRLELGLVPLGSIGMTFFAIDLYFSATPRDAFGTSLITVLMFFQESQGWHILLDLLMFSIFGGLYIVPLYTLIQERCEITYRSRTIAANNILNAFFLVISSGFIIFMIHIGLNVPQMFLVLAVTNGMVAVYICTILPNIFKRILKYLHYLSSK